MSRQSARVLLVLSCLLAAAAVFQSFRFSQAHQVERTRLLGIERAAGSLAAKLTEMRGAQMAYLATGQGPEFWMRRASELAVQVEDELARFRQTIATPGAVSRVDAASVALGELVRLDGRARSAIESDQRFLASDIIFAEAIAGAQQIAAAVAAARDEERAQIEATLGRDNVLHLALFPATLIVGLLSAWLAGRASRPRSARSDAEEVAQMLRELPPPVKAPGVAAATAPPVATPPSRPAAAPVAALTPSPAPAPAATTIDLAVAAELCVDLARVIDARDLPSLLGRAARTLNATGIIVWVVDTHGTTLTPALAHGYPDRVLAKLGALDVNADNVTSLSYRSMRPQAMPSTGGAGSSSAIAVPLVTTDGCNGVLAAEVPGAKPGEDRLAVARILAAQLATMLGPLEPTERRAAEA